MLSQKKRTLLIILVLIAIVVFVYLVFILNKTKENTVNVNLSNNQLETLSVVDTSTWLTYESKEKGLKFKYPPNLEVLNETDYIEKYNIKYPLDDGLFIVLPAKYPDIKNIDYKNPETFLNYEINVSFLPEKPEFYGSTTEEVLNKISGSVEFKSVINNKGETFFVSNNKSQVFYIGKSFICSFFIEGFNPSEKSVKETLKIMNNSQLTEWVEHYSDYIVIMEGMYSTFEVTD
jgi:ABC-type antimicrobial peptide transport system permease subunit